MENQQGPTVHHMELCWMLCGSLDVMDTFTCMAESVRWTPEIVTILFITYTPIQNKKFKGKMFRTAVEKRLGSSHDDEEGKHGDAVRLKEGCWAVWVTIS